MGTQPRPLVYACMLELRIREGRPELKAGRDARARAFAPRCQSLRFYPTVRYLQKYIPAYVADPLSDRSSSLSRIAFPTTAMNAVLAPKSYAGPGITSLTKVLNPMKCPSSHCRQHMHPRRDRQNLRPAPPSASAPQVSKSRRSRQKCKHPFMEQPSHFQANRK